MTRILLSTDAVGGVWRYSLELAQGLAARGIEVVLAVLGPEPDADQRQEANDIAGVRLHWTGLPLDWTAASPGALEQSARGLASLAWQVQADSVHLHSPALMGSVVWPVPVVVTAHSCVATWWQAVRGGPLPDDLQWRAEAMARGLAAADAVIAPSHSFAAAVRHCYRVRRRITVIHNGRSPKERTPSPARARRQAIALTAGRLWDEGKGLATLDAAAGLVPHAVHAAGPVAGPHGARIACRHLHLRGTLNEAELARAYAGAAVFVSAARYEPFGLAVLEAAQAGCALLLSDIRTFRELWNGAAVFVPAEDPDRLADAMRHLLDTPASCAHFGAVAQARAARFAPHSMAAATWATHAALLAREAA